MLVKMQELSLTEMNQVSGGVDKHGNLVGDDHGNLVAHGNFAEHGNFSVRGNFGVRGNFSVRGNYGVRGN